MAGTVQEKLKGSTPYEEAIAAHLIARSEEDPGLAEDILRKDKSLVSCYEYIRDLARKLAKNGCAAVEDSQVYEWAEDYFRAEEPKKAKKATEKKAAKADAANKEPAKPKKQKASADPKPQEEPKPEVKKTKKAEKKPKKQEIEGQMSLFDFM